MEDNTLNQDLKGIIKEQSEEEFAASHDGCKNFIEFFNTHEKVLIFGVSDRRTLDKQNLRAIVRHIVRSLKPFNRRSV